MARIPQSFIDTLLERADIADVVGRRVSLKRAGNELTACCPFHDEKTPSFTVVPAKQFYHCFGCGANGTALSFLMDYDRLEFRDAVEVLAGELGLEIPEEAEQSTDDGPPRQPIYAILSWAERLFRRGLREHAPAIDYLKQRGVSGQTAQRFGIGYASGTGQDLSRRLTDGATAIEAGLLIERDNGGAFDRFRNRLMFPIRDTRGRTIAFGGRTLGEDRAKYLNSPETPVFHKSKQLYGLYEARQANRQLTRLLVVEGYMDVVALAEGGFDNSVATLGTATTEAQIRLLFRYTDEVVFCFDGDEAGQRAADKALQRCLPALRGSRRARFLFVPAGEDPDSIVAGDNGPALFQQHIDAARSASTLLIEQITSGIDLTSVDGKVQFIERARAPVAALPIDTFRDELIGEIGRLSGHTVDDLKTRLAVAASDNRTDKSGSEQTPDRHAIEKSAVSRALTRLLSDPELAHTVNNPDRLRQSDTRGTDILAQAIEFFTENPTVTVAHWIERHRGDRYFDRLHALASDVPPGDRDGRSEEFAQSIRRLTPQSDDRQALRLRYRELLAEQAQQPLAEDAAAELRDISQKLAGG